MHFWFQKWTSRHDTRADIIPCFTFGWPNEHRKTKNYLYAMRKLQQTLWKIQRYAKLNWIPHCIQMIVWWDSPVFHLGEWWCMWMGEEWAPGQAGQKMRWLVIVAGEWVCPCTRIYVPVPCPRFIFGKVEGPEKIHCVEHLRRDSVSRSTSTKIGDVQ